MRRHIWLRNLPHTVQDFRVWLSNLILPRVTQVERENATSSALCRAQGQVHEYRRNQSYLQGLLDQSRSEVRQLKSVAQYLRGPMEAILQKTTEELRQTAGYDIYVRRDGRWEAVTNHCCLGGCDMNIVSFPTERDALLFAALLDAIHYCPPQNIACSACYAEYMKDCI